MPGAGQGRGARSGDSSVLLAEIVASDAKYISARSPTFGDLRLPRQSVSALALRQVSPLPLGEGQGVRAVLAEASGTQSDRLLLDNGDELTGSLVALADGVVRFETDVGPVSIKTERVDAVIFSHAQSGKEPKPHGLRAWLGFRDGSRLLATQLLVAGQTLKLKNADTSLSAAPSSLVFLQPLGGRAAYLSDLVPAACDQRPFLDLGGSQAPRAGLSWPYCNDRNVTGGPLRCGGHLYLKGLGVHSAARLVYDISPLPLGAGQGGRAARSPLTRFQSNIGIDDSTAGQGSVQFRVLVDGQERYVSPIIRGGNPPLPVSIDVTGGKQLELIVDYADRADVQDHADWLNARVVQ